MTRIGCVAMLLSALLVAGTTLSGSPAPPSPLAPLLAEANRDFTYRGKPINPRAIKELLSWLSDSVAGPVAIDLGGTWNSDRYYGDSTEQPDGTVRIELRTTSVTPTPGESGWFAYRRVGTLASGIHVVETWDNGGGTGVFTSLLFIRFAIDQEQADEGRRERLVMARAGEVTLGDRYDGGIRILRNDVEIGPNRRTGAGAHVLSLDWLR